MTQEERLLWKVARAIYEGRKRDAWGAGFKNAFPDLDDPKAMRAYPHNPVAEVELALASAREVLKLFSVQEAKP